MDALQRVPVVVTVEEHSAIGGLGSAVAEIVAETNFDTAKRFKRIGLPDLFPDEYGSQPSLMEKDSITSENVASVVASLASPQVPPVSESGGPVHCSGGACCNGGHP